jgi:hypothetical protein
MTNVQFENEFIPNLIQRERGTKGLSGFLLKVGIVRTETQAHYVFLVVITISVILMIVRLTTITPSVPAEFDSVEDIKKFKQP